MKKWTILSMALVLTSLQAMAQDDMYFMPSKKQKAEREAARQARQANSNYERIDYRDYSGSNRNVDENNRMGSQVDVLPADTGDVITFDPVEGVYPDSVGDYQLTKQMTRFDDYVPSIAYWEGYSAGRRDAWGWYSPWYYSSLYSWYDPWYYDPWYSYGWYDPWYYDPWYYNYGWRHYGYWGGYYYHPVVYVGGGGYHYSGTSGNRSRFGNDSYGNTSRVRNYTGSSRFDGARQRAGGGAISRGNGSSTTYGSTRNQGTTYGSPRNTTNGTPRGTTTTTRRAINNTSVPVRSTTNSSTYGTSRMNTSTYGGSMSTGSMSTGSMSTGRSTGSSMGSSRGGGGSAGGGARGGRR